MPDARWGESVHAVVVARHGSDAEPEVLKAALLAWCRTHLASYKCPRSVSFVAAMPLSAAGKILKTALRAAHRAGVTE
ncbi:hypothetical protein [Ramlibacter sp. WS9]|uniref:AMP-binding enzyme n=1 Tax=Ramlibacter sp. WS9 TaxID=1882741 RepID=UPI0021058672|nr:hypothetical protein [Ramlibacter sp. WS9]